MDELLRWQEYAERLQATALRMIEVLKLPLATEAESIAVALLARTISNFDCTTVLLRIKRVIEARILARCCVENLIFVGRLAKEGDQFIRKMFHHENIKSRQRGERFLASKFVEKGSDVEAMLRQALKPLPNAKGKAVNLDPLSVSRGTAVENAHHIYSTLSADSSHPSISALRRHAVVNAEGDALAELLISPWDRDEAIQTWEFACEGLLGVCFGAGEILGGSDAAPAVRQRADELLELRRTSAIYKANITPPPSPT